MCFLFSIEAFALSIGSIKIFFKALPGLVGLSLCILWYLKKHQGAGVQCFMLVYELYLVTSCFKTWGITEHGFNLEDFMWEGNVCVQETCKINAFIKVVRKMLLLQEHFPSQFERSDFNSNLVSFPAFPSCKGCK